MKKIGLLLVVWILASGMSCLPEVMNIKDEQGNMLAGRECVKQPDGGMCCTTMVPVQGKMVEASKCYGPGEQPE